MVCTSRQCLIKWINATSKQGKHEYLIHEQNKTKVVVGACMFWYIYPLIGCCGESCFKSMKKNEENQTLNTINQSENVLLFFSKFSRIINYFRLLHYVLILLRKNW